MTDYSLVIVAVLCLVVLYVVWLKVLAPKLAGVRKIGMGDYRELFRKQSHLLLDVRSESEYKAAHAPKARHMPVEMVAKASRSELDELIRGKPVVCICASGNRSTMAATVIARHGFAPVYSLNGGMGAWSSAGETVRRSNA